MVVGRIFPGGVTTGFFQNFPGDGKSGEICFFPLKTKKTTFFAKKFKIQGGKSSPAPTLRRPWIFYSFSRLIAIVANTNAHFYAREEQILTIGMIVFEE